MVDAKWMNDLRGSVDDVDLAKGRGIALTCEDVRLHIVTGELENALRCQMIDEFGVARCPLRLMLIF